MVESVLRAAQILPGHGEGDRAQRGGGVSVRVKLTHATRGTSARADPIATLFEAGRVRRGGSRSWRPSCAD